MIWEYAKLGRSKGGDTKKAKMYESRKLCMYI